MSSRHLFAMGITRLRKDPGTVISFEFSGTIPDLKVVSSYVDDDEEITAVGTAESVHGGIMITGTISTRWKGECRRCLGPASGSLEVFVRELFERVEPDSPQLFEGEIYPYTGDIIDLQEMVKDQVLLELPLAPLCREECKGLCVSCGADLNLGSCACDSVAIDPRWSTLDVLVDKDR